MRDIFLQLLFEFANMYCFEEKGAEIMNKDPDNFVFETEELDNILFYNPQPSGMEFYQKMLQNSYHRWVRVKIRENTFATKH